MIQTADAHSNSTLESEFQDEEREQDEPKRGIGHILRWPIRIFMLFVVLVVGILIELLIASGREVSLESATIDASQPLPHGEFQVQFEHESHLSTVTIQHIHCDLEESGAIEFQVHPPGSINDLGNSSASTYTIHATCPDEDVQAHADLVWKLLTQQEATGVGAFECQMEIQINFAHFIPYTHTIIIDNSWVEEFKLLEKPNPPMDESSFDSSSADTAAHLDARPTPFALRQLNMTNLELAYQMKLPKNTMDIASKIQIILPPLGMEATDFPTTAAAPSNGTTGSLSFAGLNASFSSEEITDYQHHDDAWASFSLACPSSEDCLWFSPIVDWYSRAPYAPDGRLIVDVSVNGDGSFLERMLGPQHMWYIQWTLGVQDQLPQGHRRATSVFDEVFLNEAANCLGLTSADSDAFNFAWCWVLSRFEGFQVVGMADVYDYTTKAIVETSWDLDDDAETFDLLASVLIEFGEDKKLLNTTGDLQIDWSGLDIVTVETKGINSGTWLPFKTTLKGNVRWDTDDVFILEMEKGKLIWENDLLADAAGSLVVDTDKLTARGILKDPDEGLHCDMFGEVLSDVEKLRGSSFCEFGGNTVWDIGLNSGITWNIDETHWTVYMDFDESVASFTVDASFGFADDTDGQYSIDMVLDGESIVGAAGKFLVDTDQELFEFSMIDSGRLDYGAIVKGEWTSISDFFKLQLYELSLRQEQTIHMNVTADFAVDLVMDRVEFSIEDSDSLSFSFDSITRWDREESWDWEGSFAEEKESDEFTVFFDRIFLEWENGKAIDWTGKLFIDILNSSTQLEFADSGYLAIFLNLDMSWTDDSTTDEFSLFLHRLLLGWKEETRADLTGQLIVDLDGERLVASLADDNALDLTSAVDVRWPDFDDSLITVLVLESSSVIFRDEKMLDATGRFEVNEESNFIKATMDDPNGLGARANGTVSWIYDRFTDYFLLNLERFLLEWDGEAKVDLTASLRLDEETEWDEDWYYYRLIGEDLSMHIFAENVASPTFFAELDMTSATAYFSDPDVSFSRNTTFSVDRAVFQIDDETYVDQKLVVEDLAYYGFGFGWNMYCASEEDADLVMDMDMTITKQESGSLRMVMDHMKLGWQGTTWIDAGNLVRTEEPPTFPPAAPVTIDIQGIEMRLEGAKELDEKGKEDFEATLEEFYDDTYITSRRRYLVGGLGDFATEVTVTGQQVDKLGNTVTYDQKVTFLFSSNDGDTAATKAKELLLEPLSSNEQRVELVGALQAQNPDVFGSVTSFQSPSLSPKEANPKKEEPKDNDTMVIAMSTIAAVLVCCGGLGYYFYRRRRPSAEQEELTSYDLEDPRASGFSEYKHPLNPEDQTEEFHDEDNVVIDKDGEEEESDEDGDDEEEDNDEDEDSDDESDGEDDDSDTSSSSSGDNEEESDDGGSSSERPQKAKAAVVVTKSGLSRTYISPST